MMALQVLSNNWENLTDTDKISLLNSVSLNPATISEIKTAFDDGQGGYVPFKVVVFDETGGKPTVTLTAIPPDKLVVPKGLIPIKSFSAINSITVTASIGGTGNVRIAVTINNIDYYTYNFSTENWDSVNPTVADVATSGLTPSQLSFISSGAWDSLLRDVTGVGFAYLLSIDEITDTAAIDAITLNVDMRGRWRQAINGTDFTAEYGSNTSLTVNLLANGDYKINYPT